MTTDERRTQAIKELRQTLAVGWNADTFLNAALDAALHDAEARGMEEAARWLSANSNGVDNGRPSRDEEAARWLSAIGAYLKALAEEFDNRAARRRAGCEDVAAQRRAGEG